MKNKFYIIFVFDSVLRHNCIYSRLIGPQADGTDVFAGIQAVPQIH